MAFGDSLTAGYRLPIKDSYPAQLEQLLIQDGYKVQITNAGVSGDTSEQGLRRIDWILKQGNYDIVLLCLGANDGLRQLPVKNLEENLLKVIDKFQAAGSKVLLLGMQLPPNLYRGYRGEFEAVYKRVADKKRLPYLPFILEGVAANSKLNLEDMIHPNKDGYAVVAQHVMKFLKSKLN